MKFVKIFVLCLLVCGFGLGAFACETGVYRHVNGSEEIVMEKGQGKFFHLVSEQHNYSVIGQCTTNRVFEGIHSETGEKLYLKKIANNYEYGSITKWEEKIN